MHTLRHIQRAHIQPDFTCDCTACKQSRCFKTMRVRTALLVDATYSEKQIKGSTLRVRTSESEENKDPPHESATSVGNERLGVSLG